MVENTECSKAETSFRFKKLFKRLNPKIIQLQFLNDPVNILLHKISLNLLMS